MLHETSFQINNMYSIGSKKKHSDFTKKLSETDIINILEFLIDNIFVFFGRRV